MNYHLEAQNIGAIGCSQIALRHLKYIRVLTSPLVKALPQHTCETGTQPQASFANHSPAPEELKMSQGQEKEMPPANLGGDAPDFLATID